MHLAAQECVALSVSGSKRSFWVVQLVACTKLHNSDEHTSTQNDNNSQVKKHY
jgi:hypothetical protein